MALPATLPAWLQTVNTGMFGRGAQLGEEMRANRAAEQFKQQELMRQRQQDAIAQQQHQQEMQRQSQREAIQDQQWKAEFGLRQQENKARIDIQAQQVKTAASKLAAQQQLQKSLAEWQAKPERDMNEYYNIIARYGPAAGVNIGSMLSQQARPAPAPKLAPAKPTGPKPLTEEQRDHAIDRRQKELDKLRDDPVMNTDASTDTPIRAAKRKQLQDRIDAIQSEIDKLDSGQELYGSTTTPNQEAAGAYVPPKISRGGAVGGTGTPPLSWNPKTGWSDQQQSPAQPAVTPATGTVAPAPYAPNPLTGMGGGGFALGKSLAAPKPAPMPPAPAIQNDPAKAALVKKLLDQLGGAQIPPTLTNQPPVATP